MLGGFTKFPWDGLFSSIYEHKGTHPLPQENQRRPYKDGSYKPAKRPYFLRMMGIGGRGYLEDHPRTCKQLGSPQFIAAMEFGHVEGVGQPST